MQYYQEKPLGRNHPDYAGEKVPEAEKERNRPPKRHNEEDKEAYPDRRNMQLKDKLKDDLKRPNPRDDRNRPPNNKNPKPSRNVASPNDV